MMNTTAQNKLDSALCEAVRAGDAKSVEQLLNLGAKDCDRNSLFHLASQMRHFEITRLLTEYSQDMGASPRISEKVSLDDFLKLSRLDSEV